MSILTSFVFNANLPENCLKNCLFESFASFAVFETLNDATLILNKVHYCLTKTKVTAFQRFMLLKKNNSFLHWQKQRRVFRLLPL